MDNTIIKTDEKDIKIKHLEHKLKNAQLIIEDNKLQMEYMKQEIALLKNQAYGRRSEQLDKQYPNLFNYDIFNEAEDTQDELVNEPIDFQTGEAKEVSFTASDKKKKNLVNRLDNLEEEIIIHDLTTSELKCQDCESQLEKIGEKVIYKLKYIPAKLVKEKHVFPTYKCGECYKDDITKIISAKHYTSFPKTMVDSSIVANLITEKFVKYLPLYRQEKLFRNIGLDISRANLSNWFLAGAKLLKPLVELMHKDLLKYEIIYMDETTLQVIKSCRSQCYIWGMSSSKHDKPIRLYFYMKTREHNNARILLGNYQGYIQSDCYQAYAKLDGCIDVACIAHARRKYADIVKATAGKLLTTNSLCLEALEFLNDLYKIEHRLERQKASIEEIYEIRNNEASMILISYKQWLDKNYETVPAQSHLGKAMAYSINNYHNLCNYLLDGRLAIDNNLSERCMKNFVIGRKNFLFCFTEAGADCSAIAYSVVETAIANNLNVYEYLKYIFDTLPYIKSRNENELRSLLPYSTSLPDKIRVKK